MGMFDSYVRNKYNDSRFNLYQHFSISDVNARFLKKHGINKTVAEFKKEVKGSRYEFKAKTGNAKAAPMKSTKIYNINNFK